ncbi:BCCT family transporter [Streptomyces hirsutus]|uniref:BCCT family transporter n=1 Tax=Streptomyces hirsutus TaxID=35620 RepID=UPI00362CBAE8
MPDRTLETLAYQDGGSEWMAGWTLFSWAFRLAWGPFVGLFLARISRGRTLREFTVAAVTAPVLCDFLLVSIFGNSAMVMPNFFFTIRTPSQDGAKWLRVFWAVLTAVLTIAMLVADGVTTMEYATLIFALPVTVIAWLVMASFSKALRMERAEREGRVLRRQSTAAHGGQVPERTWRQRLERMRSYPSKKQVAQFMERTVQPALADVVREFGRQGYEASLVEVTDEHTDVAGHALVVVIPEHRDFHYQVLAVEAPVPMFGGRMSRQTDVYYRAEVFTQTGSEGYDLMGVSHQQVIDDVLDRYEAHLAFLTYTTEHDSASLITPPVATASAVAAVGAGGSEGGSGRGRRGLC